MSAVNYATCSVSSNWVMHKEHIPPEKSSVVGIGFIFTGVLIWTISSIIIKELENAGVPFIQVTFVRYTVVVILAGAAIAYKRCQGEELWFFGRREERVLLVIRAILYYGALNFYYWSLVYIPIGLATVIGFSFPIVIAVIYHWGCLTEPERLTRFG